MKQVKEVVVIFEDGTDKTFTGSGYFQETRSTRKEEVGVKKFKIQPVHQIHVTINIPQPLENDE